MAKKIEPPITSSQKLQNQILSVMAVMKEDYSECSEYKTIMMNLTTISRELNSITLKEVQELSLNELR